MAELEYMHDMAAAPSVLDDLGEEVTGILAPVSVCMAITVALVRLLNPDGSGSSSNAVMIASLAYSEDNTDTNSAKFSGALLNAIIFAGIMAAMTFLLVILFKYGCFKVIYVYMAFAVFDIFFLITAIVSLQVLQALDIHVDVMSFIFGLWNFAIVGTVGVLFIAMPLLAKQGYMLWIGVMTAYIFTWVPEWTSWILIVVMALYDIAAVLIPGGPLNMLVKVATERQEMLPALLYEARPTRGPYQPNQFRARGADPSGEALATRSDSALRPLTQGNQWDVESSPDSNRSGNNTPRGGQIGTYQPPDMSAAAAAAAAVGGSLSHVSTDNRAPSPRLTMSPAAGGPIISGGSAQIMPLPQGGISGGGGLQKPASRPSSAGSSRPSSAGHRRVDGQEMAATSRLATSASAHTSMAGAPPPPSGSGSGVDPSSGLPRSRGALGSGGKGKPLGEGLEDDQVLGTYKPLRGGDGSIGNKIDSSKQDIAGASSPAALGPLGASDTTRTGPLSTTDPNSTSARVSGTGAPPSTQAPSGAVQWTTFGSAQGPPGGADPPPPQQPPQSQIEIELPDSIKLGLGDFIFYSMLVGRAAMYDYMTVFASYIGIIAGLGITLVCLAAYQKALPALPFSIALGVLFYFLTRLVLEPYIVPLASSLTFY